MSSDLFDVAVVATRLGEVGAGAGGPEQQEVGDLPVVGLAGQAPLDQLQRLLGLAQRDQVFGERG